MLPKKSPKYRFSFHLLIKNKYKEKYTSSTKGHYEGIDKKTMHAMKARKLASDVSLVFHKLSIV